MGAECLMADAIFALDPGDHTGVIALLLDTPKQPRNPILRISAINIRAYSLPKDPPSHTTRYERQAMMLYHLWIEFRFLASRHYGVPADKHHLVIEDYTHNPIVRSTKRETFSPLYVSMCFQGIRMGEALWYERQNFGATSLPPINWQIPAQKSHIQDARLKRAGLWIKGDDHKRDALRHAIIFGRKLGYAGLLDPITSVPSLKGYFRRSPGSEP